MLIIDAAFSCDYVFNALRKNKARDLLKGQQEDAQEFLGFLLDAIHEELLATIDRPSVEPESGEPWTEVCLSLSIPISLYLSLIRWLVLYAHTHDRLAKRTSWCRVRPLKSILRKLRGYFLECTGLLSIPLPTKAYLPSISTSILFLL